HGLHLRIGLALLNCRDDAVTDAGRQGVDGGIIDGDHGDVAIDLEAHQRLVALTLSTYHLPPDCRSRRGSLVRQQWRFSASPARANALRPARVNGPPRTS